MSPVSVVLVEIKLPHEGSAEAKTVGEKITQADIMRTDIGTTCRAPMILEILKLISEYIAWTLEYQ